MIIRNKYQINYLIKEKDNLIILGEKDNLIILGEKICSIPFLKKDFDILGNALGGFKINEGVLYFTEKTVYLFDFVETPKKICQKDSLDFVTVFNNNLLIINEKSFFIYDIKDNFKFQNISVTYKGVCVGSVIWDKRLYLGYENGSICFIEDIDKNNYTDVSMIEIIKMDENISSFDISNDSICIAFFDKKIAVCDLTGNNFKYTEIKFNPKLIKFWKMHILCLDGENNLFLLDNNLKILYSENFENNLVSFDIINDLMYQIYKDGTIIVQENIKEYIN